MASTAGRIKPVELTRLSKTPGMHCDGAGLYLRVAPPGASSWVLRYMLDSKARTMGLGPYPDVTLAEARVFAGEARKLKAYGQDPIAARNAAKASLRLEAANAMTFKQCAEAYIASHRAGWKNAKHAEQWPSTLKAYAYELIGPLPVAAIDTAAVLRVLQQDAEGVRLWEAKPETASRLRGRLEAILDWARVGGFRTGENPARWKGHLEHQLPARSKVSKVEHHAALPYDQLPAFMTDLRKLKGMSASALEFAILTAARTGEVLGARWGEIDMAAKLWIVPADRMKAGREHRVPLSDRTIEILANIRAAAEANADEGQKIEPDTFVFEGGKAGRPMSNMAMLMLLRRMGCDDLTAHGFRSSFRDWGAEVTTFPSEVLEMALAHTVGDKVEAAYRRGDLFERRQALMATWAAYCDGKSAGNVTPLHKAGAA